MKEQVMGDIWWEKAKAEFLVLGPAMVAFLRERELDSA
jgi:hypothetical protein